MVSVILTAAGLEAGLRVMGYSPIHVNALKSFHEPDPKLGWRGKRLSSGRFKRLEFDVLAANNENGFRNTPHLKTDGTSVSNRVFVFGDSFVWGWGVADDEVLTDRMNLLLTDSRVFNYGINGIGTVVEYLLFESEVKHLVRPGDVVVLLFCRNDFADNVDPNKVHARVADGAVTIVKAGRRLQSPLQEFLRGHSYLCNFAAHKANLYKLKRALHKQTDEHLRTSMNSSDPRHVVTSHFLGRFAADCAARQAAFVVAYIPTQTELGESLHSCPNKAANDKVLRDTLFSMAQALGIQTLDLRDPFLEHKNRTGAILTFPQDQHWNRTGHQVAAEVLSAWLRQQTVNPANRP